MSVGYLNFNGTNQYLRVSPSNSLVLSGDLTIEFFCKCTVTSGNNGLLMSAPPLLISVNRAVENNVRLYFNIIDMSSYFPQKSINDNLWHHIAIVRKGMLTNNITVFVDGQIDAYITNTSTWNYGSGFIIGGYLYNGQPYTPNSYKGFVSNLRICNYAVYSAPFQIQLNNLTPIPGTVLLLNMAFDNPYVDSSPNSILVTPNNNPTPAQEAPPENQFFILSTDKKTVTSYNANIDVTGKIMTIPTTVTSISPNAFLNSSTLASITIPPGVASVGPSAFQGCLNLTSVTLQRTSAQGLTTLGTNCFVNVPLTLQSILQIYKMGYTRQNLIKSGIPTNTVDQVISNEDGSVIITMYHYFTG